MSDPDQAMAYLVAALEEKDGNIFLMTSISKKTRLGRESLYKSFSKKGNPAWNSVKKVVEALGWQYTLIKKKKK